MKKKMNNYTNVALRLNGLLPLSPQKFYLMPITASLSPLTSPRS